MNSIVTVTSGPHTYALFMPADLPVEGVQFLTQPTDDFQVGVMERPAGHDVKAHQHPPIERTITTTSEFLYIEKGKVEVTVFDEEWNSLGKQVLGPRQFLLFLRGGHQLKMLEPTRMIEVKQGPFPGDAAGKVYRELDRII